MVPQIVQKGHVDVKEPGVIRGSIEREAFTQRPEAQSRR
jgi:hypothetical protein